jgi:histidyl-tRNA synthetase
MAGRFQVPRGTQDILPEQQPYWDAVLEAAREVTRLHGFHRIDTPVFEDAALFEKGTGDTTDIVEKEMYVFKDRGGDLLALTPEGTPAICRAYLEHGMASLPQPVRLFTTHPMFRYDRPQKGRYRQHTQVDCEVIGSADPLVDAEVIALLWQIYERLGLTGLEVRLSSIDDLGPRQAYVERLKQYYAPHAGRLSEDSQRRLHRNPLRLLDSKDERDLPFKADAPKLVEQLSAPAQEHHEAVMAALTASGIPFSIDPLLVRGLDYYNRTVFEIVPVADERAQSALGGGGRYDGLMELIGGPPTPAIGFGSGIERIVLEMQRCGVAVADASGPDVFIAHRSGGSARVFALGGVLRRAGIATVLGESSRSWKSQMRSADASGARFVVVIGDDELAAGVAGLKDLRDGGEQSTVPLDRLAPELLSRLGRA